MRLVISIDPFQGFLLDLANGFPRFEEIDDLSLEQTGCAFGQSIVIGSPDTANRGVDPGLGQPLGVSDLQVLSALDWYLLVDGLVQSIENKAGRH